MINYDFLNWYYWLYSDKDIWKYWPFDSVWVKWNFYWWEFEYNIDNLKSWKNCIWKFNNEIFVFEEVDSNLNMIN